MKEEEIAPESQISTVLISKSVRAILPGRMTARSRMSSGKVVSIEVSEDR